MSKSRKQQLQEYHFDEASSGSDDNDSSDEEDDYEQLQSMRKEKSTEEPPPRRRQQVIGKNSSESDSDDGDDDSDSGISDNGSADSEQETEHEGRRKVPDAAAADDDDSDQEQGDSSSDEEDAPLHQRVLKKEGRGSMQRSSRRERKSRALEEATKRLASFKESQRKKKLAESGPEKSTKRETNEAGPIKKKKKNKHKPTEVSSKRADFFARGARRLNESGLGIDIGAHRYKPMDPRASSLSGHFDEDQFHKNYAFLEEMRNKEIGQVRKRIAAHKATGKKGNRMRKKLQIIDADGGHASTLEEDVARLKTLTETRANLERRKIDRAARQSVKRKIREDVESGRSGAYFLKRKEKKRLELEARFEEIRKRGGEKAVEKMLAKKRQKNKSRDASAFAK